MNRRQILIAAMTSSALLVAGCETPRRRRELDLVEVVRRLLILAAMRAFADLMRDGGFYDSALNRIRLPRSLAGMNGSRGLMNLLVDATLRDGLERLANRAAERGAALAAPIVTETVRGMPVLDAMALVRGEPGAASAFLRDRLGPDLVRRMVPEIGHAMRATQTPVLGDYLSRLTQVDFGALTNDVSTRAGDVIFAAIAREEQAIRSDPASTNDPLLISAFGL